MYKENRSNTFQSGDVVYVSRISGVGFLHIELNKYKVVGLVANDYRVRFLENCLTLPQERPYFAEFSPSWIAKTLDEAIQELADYDGCGKDKIVKLIFEYKP